MNPKSILTIVAIILALVSYYPGAPTLGAAVIILGAANLIP
jgi:hypothetical protein